MRSRNPPWPGMMCPESFTFTSRFTIEMARSPKGVSVGISTPIIGPVPIPSLNHQANSMETARPATSPPKAPSQVFLGLQRGDI